MGAIRSGASSGYASVSFELTATTVSPRADQRWVSRPNSRPMCTTNGQWLQMNITSTPGVPSAADVLQVVPSGVGSSKAGSVVPGGIETPPVRQGSGAVEQEEVRCAGSSVGLGHLGIGIHQVRKIPPEGAGRGCHPLWGVIGVCIGVV